MNDCSLVFFWLYGEEDDDPGGGDGGDGGDEDSVIRSAQHPPLGKKRRGNVILLRLVWMGGGEEIGRPVSVALVVVELFVGSKNRVVIGDTDTTFRTLVRTKAWRDRSCGCGWNARELVVDGI